MQSSAESQKVEMNDLLLHEKCRYSQLNDHRFELRSVQQRSGKAAKILHFGKQEKYGELKAKGTEVILVVRE